MTTAPKRNLPPQAEPWGRDMEAKVKRLEAVVGLVNQRSRATNRTVGSGFATALGEQTSSEQEAEDAFREAFERIQEELAPEVAPPAPTRPVIASKLSSIVVHWDGLFVDGMTPRDVSSFAHVYAQICTTDPASWTGPGEETPPDDSEEDPDLEEPIYEGDPDGDDSGSFPSEDELNYDIGWHTVGQAMTEAGAAVVPRSVGENIWFRLVAANSAGLESYSEYISIDVLGVQPEDLDDGIIDAIDTALSTAQQVALDLEAARQHLDATLAQLEQEVGDATALMEAAEGRLDDAEQRITDAFTASSQAQQDAAAALAAAEAAIGANAIADPGLETPSMWTDRLADAGSRFSIATTGARSGAGALQVTEGATNAVLALGTTPVKVGMVLRFQAWVNTPSGLPSSERPVIEYVDQSGAVITSTTMPTSAASGSWSLWSSFLTTTEAHSGVATVTARLRVRHTAARTILFDDFELVDYTTAQELTGAVSTLVQQKPSIFYRTDLPGSTYAAVGSTWFQVDTGGNVIAQFQQATATIGNPPVVGADWRPTEITSEVIANLDVGKLRAGASEIDDLVAQKIAGASGQFLELDVSQLTASDAAFDVAVADKLWSDEFVTRLATAQQIIAGDAIIEGSITGDKIAANSITADQIDANGLSVRNLSVGAYGPNFLPPLAAGQGWVGGDYTVSYYTDPTFGPAARLTNPPSTTNVDRAFSIEVGELWNHPVGGADNGVDYHISGYFRRTSAGTGSTTMAIGMQTTVWDTSPSSSVPSRGSQILNDNRGFLATEQGTWYRFRIPISTPLSGWLTDLHSARVRFFLTSGTARFNFDIAGVELVRSETKTFIDGTRMTTDEVKTRTVATANLTATDSVRADQNVYAGSFVNAENNVRSAKDLVSFKRLALRRAGKTETLTPPFSEDDTNFVMIYAEDLERMKAMTADTGWVNLSGYLNSGFSGTLRARVVGSQVEIVAMNVTGSFPAGGTTIDFFSGIPTQFRPSQQIRMGNAWRSGYNGSLVVRPDGSGGISQRTVDWAAANYANAIFLKD